MIENKIYRDPETGQWAVKIRSLTFTLNKDYTLEAVKIWRDEEIARWDNRDKEEAEHVNAMARMELME